MEFTGFIKEITAVERKTSKNGTEYEIATVVVETQDARPDSMAFTLINSKINEMIDIGVGNIVKVTWHCHVNMWNNRYCNNINVAKIERQVVVQSAEPQGYQPSF